MGRERGKERRGERRDCRQRGIETERRQRKNRSFLG